jgi:hypothetical protein
MIPFREIKPISGTQAKEWTKDWTFGVRFSARETYFSLLHRVQTGCEAHRTSYIMAIRDSFLEGKAAEVLI